MLARLRHLFTPHRSNDHRPRLLQPAGLALLIGIFLFSDASLKLLAAYDNQIVRGNVLGYASDISVEQVINLTNQERIKLGKAPLKTNALLSLAAQNKANDMFTFDYWAHNNPVNGKQPWNFIREAGYTYRYAGENLARDFGDTLSVMAAWMASPTHRDNVTSDRYSEIGIAVVNGELQGIETTLVVQMFGTAATQQAVTTTSTLGQTQPNEPETKIKEQTLVESTAKDTLAPIGLAQASEIPANQNLVPPFAISKAISMSILLLLSITLIIDYLIIKRRRTITVSGKNLAHLAFIGTLIILVLMSAPGGIL